MTSHIDEAALNEYVDGSLPAEECARVERHLSACDACAASAAALFRLVEEVRALPRSVRPSRDLRPAIRARIGGLPDAPRRRAPVEPGPGARSGAAARALAAGVRPRRLAQAAAVVLLVASTAAVTRWLVLRDAREAGSAGAAAGAPAAVAAPDRPEAGDVVALAAFRRDESRYTAAIAELEAALRRDRARLAPETLRILRRNLEVIDRALAESRAALARDPANAELERMILSTYSKKLELLRRAREFSS